MICMHNARTDPRPALSMFCFITVRATVSAQQVDLCSNLLQVTQWYIFAQRTNWPAPSTLDVLVDARVHSPVDDERLGYQISQQPCCYSRHVLLQNTHMYTCLIRCCVNDVIRRRLYWRLLTSCVGTFAAWLPPPLSSLVSYQMFLRLLCVMKLS